MTICPVCHAFNCPCAAAAQALDTLDEERLARALFARYALGHIAFPCGEDTEVEAAAIAKAYREDTDA